MYAVIVDFEVTKTSANTFKTLVLENAKTSLNKEKACRVFDVCFDPERPSKLFLYELYDSEDDFSRHLNSEHFKAFSKAVEPMVVDKQVRTFLRVG